MLELLHDNKNVFWKIKGRSLSLQKPLVMGILNVTPDSFYDGGRHFTFERAVEHGLRLAQEGADVLDMGGMSTRPGSVALDGQEEAERILPVLSVLSSRLSIPISVDTCQSSVARMAMDAGASIVNDVSGLRDPEMISVIRDFQAGLVLMHMRGVPQTMQENTYYDSLLDELHEFFRERLHFASENRLDPEQVVIDPGIGFGKNAQQNLELLKNLESFKEIAPLVIGVSRKSFVGTVLNRPVEERLAGSLGCVAASYYHGASIIRVHDVQATKDVLKMLEEIEKYQNPKIKMQN
ncbi:MAG: dihydropteroate synthase [Chlamydiae bacterium]|nr:dihydropteroate synthase [Chlamydiota bacterium]MBI3266634.1 dihydropteroate synthase [Chlamydiota bacterium]